MSPQKLDIDAHKAALAMAGWEAVAGRDAIAKRFVFADFNAAFGWMVRVALRAEAMNHHPEWSNVYRIIDVVLTTHDVGGLSALDVTMAQFMDAAYRECDAREAQG